MGRANQPTNLSSTRRTDIRHAPGEKEFIMSVTTLSFAFVNTYAPPSAKPAAAIDLKTPPAPADDKSCEARRPAGRENRFVQAMMSALRELGFGSPAAAPAPAAATTGAPTTAASPSSNSTATTAASGAGATETPSSPDPTASVESAVHQFAHELFQALRQGGNGNSSSGEGSGRVAGEGQRRHEHRHHDGQGHGYGDLPQRLEALAQTFGAQVTGAAPATPPAAASLTVTLTVDDGSANAPAPASTTASATPPPAATTTVPVVTTAKNPLLEAFAKLFDALKPQSATTTDTDMAEKLRKFLHALAQAVAPDAMSGVHSVQPGGLVNVTA